MKLVDIFITTTNFLGVYTIASLVGLWWMIDSSNTVGVELFSATFKLLLLYAYIYEAGYKKNFKRNATKQQFYLIFLAPSLFATGGYIYGLIKFLMS